LNLFQSEDHDLGIVLYVSTCAGVRVRVRVRVRLRARARARRRVVVSFLKSETIGLLLA